MLDLQVMWLPLLFVANAWVSHGTENGVTVETRKMPGSAYESVRVSKTTKIPADVLVEAVWGPPGIEGVANRKAVTTHVVLADSPSERRYYEIISAPMISNRDYVLVVSRRKDGGVHEIRFRTVDDPAYPAKEDPIRMTVSGQCTIEPTEDGGSIITYEVFSDLKGSMPAWIARGAQRGSTVEWINVMIGRGEKRWQGAK